MVREKRREGNEEWAGYHNLFVCVRVHMCVHVSKWFCACTCVRMHLCECVRVYVCACLCVCPSVGMHGDIYASHVCILCLYAFDIFAYTCSCECMNAFCMLADCTTIIIHISFINQMPTYPHLDRVRSQLLKHARSPTKPADFHELASWWT